LKFEKKTVFNGRVYFVKGIMVPPGLEHRNVCVLSKVVFDCLMCINDIFIALIQL